MIFFTSFGYANCERLIIVFTNFQILMPLANNFNETTLCHIFLQIMLCNDSLLEFQKSLNEKQAKTVHDLQHISTHKIPTTQHIEFT